MMCSIGVMPDNGIQKYNNYSDKSRRRGIISCFCCTFCLCERHSAYYLWCENGFFVIFVAVNLKHV